MLCHSNHPLRHVSFLLLSPLPPSAYLRSQGLAAIRKLHFWNTGAQEVLTPCKKSGTHRKHQFSFSPFCSFFLRLAAHISGGERGKPSTISSGRHATWVEKVEGHRAHRQHEGLPRATYMVPSFFLFIFRTQRSYWFPRYPEEGMTPYKNPIRTIL